MISSTQTSFIIESESGCGLRNHFSQAVRTVVFWKICIGLFVCDFSKNLLGRHVELLAASFVGGWGYETFGTHWIAFGMSGGLLIVVALVSMTLPKNAVR